MIARVIFSYFIPHFIYDSSYLKGLSTNLKIFDIKKFILVKVIYYKNHEYLHYAQGVTATVEPYPWSH